MIVDALLAADEALRFSDAIWRAADFVHLDDGLLRTIESYSRFHRYGHTQQCNKFIVVCNLLEACYHILVLPIVVLKLCSSYFNTF